MRNEFENTGSIEIAINIVINILRLMTSENAHCTIYKTYLEELRIYVYFFFTSHLSKKLKYSIFFLAGKERSEDFLRN